MNETLTRCHFVIVSKMLYNRGMFKKNTNQKKESENAMKNYEVKFNSQQIIVKDNSSSIFKSRTHLNKNYITKSDKNSFVMIMFAEDFNDCLAKARQLYKDASSIEVQEIKRATTSINLINNNKKVA